MQHIVFRVDATVNIATGHLMRCLTLANKFQATCPTVVITFITGQLTAFAKENVENTSHQLIEFESNADDLNWNQMLDIQYSIDVISNLPTIDLLIVDHYQLDAIWEMALSPYCQKLLVIDDLANRKHQCDFLLDQTFGRTHHEYLSFVNPQCQLLLGQKYMLLREEFASLRITAQQKRESFSGIKNALISLGGIDLNNDTAILLDWLLAIPECNQWNINIIVSSDMPKLNELKAKTKNIAQVALIINCNNMSEQMLNADLAIGASGGTTWERCALGLPTISVVLADNQKDIADVLNVQGAHINLGLITDTTIDDFQNAIRFLEKPNNYYEMTKQCFNCCDGLGAGRAIKILNGHPVKLVPAKISDLDIVYQWQSNPAIRQYARNTQPVLYSEHREWFSHSLSLSSRHMYMINYANKAVGVLRLDEIKQATQQKRKLQNDTIESEAPTMGYEVSILVDPSSQGQGVALSALLNIPQQFNEAGVYAYVSPENIASQRLFSRANFQRIGPDKFIRTTQLQRALC